VLLPIFQPYLETGEIASLPSYNYYVKINAAKNVETLSGETILLSAHVGKRVIKQSRKNYTNRYAGPIAPQELEDKKLIDSKYYPTDNLEDEPLNA
jgi:hypothetical protein